MTDPGDDIPLIGCLSDYPVPVVEELARPHRIHVRRRDDCASTTEVVVDADVVIADAARRFPLGGRDIAAMRRCRLIQVPAVGLGAVDVAAAHRHGIRVAHAPGYNRDAVADWTMGAMVAVLRNLHGAHASMQAGDWASLPLGRELGALTVGIIGVGAIGGAVARRVEAFGSRILLHSRGAVPPGVPGTRAAFGELLEESDVVTLHVPLTVRTRGMVGRAELDRMKPDVVLVNASRGAVVDEGALVDVLRRQPARRAALDVFQVEPLAPASPLRGLDNVLLTPHVAAGTTQARRNVRELVAANLRLVLDGRTPRHLVMP